MIKISVVMPVYNGEAYLRKTIESVLGQSYGNFEFIIIDDGSTDNTLRIIGEFDDTRIRLIRSDHAGIVNALNIGLKQAKAGYIVRIDADDLCVRDRFDTLLTYMENHHMVAVCGSWATKIDENDKELGIMQYSPIEHDDIKKYALIHNPFIHPSVIFRKDIIHKAGMYKKYKHNEDYELWTRVLKKYQGHTIPEALIRYRVHSSQITKKGNLKMRFVGLWVRILAFVRLSF